MQTLDPTWDLESIFPGGSSSSQFSVFLAELAKQINSLPTKLDKLSGQASFTTWEQVISAFEDTATKLRQSAAFVHCLLAQDVMDDQAKLLNGRIRQLAAQFQAAYTNLDAKLVQLDQSYWQDLLNHPQIHHLQFVLSERRRRAQAKLPPELENLAGDLAVDGYHAWNEIYNTIVGRIQLKPDIDGNDECLSISQANNLLSHPNREIRKKVFAEYERVFQDNAELFATTLNHLSGFRLNLYRNRGWKDFLQEPLDRNRMHRETLDVMWDTISANKAKVVEFLNRKAKLLGLKQLAWYDVEAPISKTAKSVSLDEAADFIIEQFQKFDPQMADFAVQAFANRWIEAEDRSGKRPGGFCTSFPLSNQSRIFMTYGGSADNVSTLAHELGHAYHHYALSGLTYLNKHYAMNVAETASTFSEMIVADAAIKHAASDREQLSLLENKIQRSVAFFMNIHARFIFESNFYTARRQNMLTASELNEMMIEAQKEAYLDNLSKWHPYFWASKLHFFNTGVPFYNFPYTFGYLFSTGIYSRSLSAGSNFADKYRKLLRDTGRMNVEDLAKKHLGVDLTKPDFWQAAIDTIISDIDQFLRLTG